MTSLPSHTTVPTATTFGLLIDGAVADGDIEVLVTVPLWPISQLSFPEPGLVFL